MLWLPDRRDLAVWNHHDTFLARAKQLTGSSP
jgi:hypothetical protein